MERTASTGAKDQRPLFRTKRLQPPKFNNNYTNIFDSARKTKIKLVELNRLVLSILVASI